MPGPWDKYAAPAEPAEDTNPAARYQQQAPWQKYAQPATEQLVEPTSPGQVPQQEPEGPSFAPARDFQAPPVGQESQLAGHREFQRLSREDKVVAKLQQDVQHGLTTNLVSAFVSGRFPSLASVVLGALGGKQLALPEDTPTQKAADLGFVGNLATGAVSLGADPGAQALLGGVGKLVPQIPVVSKLFNSAGELALERQAAEYEMKAAGDVAEAAYQQAARRYALNRIARGAVKEGIEFGALNAATEGAGQLNRQEFDPLAIANTTVQGLGFGAVLGGGLSALGRGAKGELADATLQAEMGRISESMKPKQEALPAPVRELEAREQKLAEQRAELQKQLDDKTTRLEDDQRARLTQKIESLDTQTEALKVERQKLTAPEIAPPELLDRVVSGEVTLEEPEIARMREQQERLSQQVAKLEKERAAVEQAPKSPREAKLERQLEEVRRQREVYENDLEFQNRNSRPFEERATTRDHLGKIMRQEVDLKSQLDSLQSARSAKADARVKALDEQIGNLNDQHRTLGEQADRRTRPLSEREQKDLAKRLEIERRQVSENNELATIRYQDRLKQINDRLTQLETKRALFAREFEQPTVDDGRVTKLREQAASLEQQLAETKAAKAEMLTSYRRMLRESGPLSIKQRLSSKWETRPEYVDRAYRFADAEVQKLVDRGVLKPEQKSGFVTHYFQELLQKKGLKLSEKSAIPSNKLIRGFTQKIELMNRADKAYGTRVVDATYRLVQADAEFQHARVDESATGHQLINSLVKKGLPPEEIPRLLQYVETNGAGFPEFKPDAVTSEKLTRPEYSGPIPADKVLLAYPELGQLRLESDRVYGLATENGRKAIGYVPGYVKIMPKRGAVAFSQARPEPGAVLEPTSYKQRTVGQWDPSKHETNPHTIWQSYVDDVTRERAFEPVVPQLHAELNKLLMIGDGPAAQEFGNVIQTALGLRNKVDLSAKFAEQIQLANEDAIRSMIRSAGLEDSAADDVFKVLKQMQYEALVLRPAALIKQVLQPNLVASAEIGNRYVLLGQKAALFDPKLKEFAKQFDRELTGVEPGILEEIGQSGVKGSKARFVSKLVGLPTKLSGIKKAYSAAELFNRRATFLGGYLQFKDAAAKGEAGALDKVLDGLLDGEKARVIRALREQGSEAAAQVYGIVRSYRSNFVFSAINKPEILREGAGQLIPFTTWTTNQLARVVTDFTGSRAQLLRRIALPFVGLAAFTGITGLKLRGAHPLGDLDRSLSFELFPAISSPAKAYARTGSLGNAAAEAAKFVPGYSQYVDYQNRLMKTGSATAAAVGADPAYSQPVDRALEVLPEFLRKAMR